jgi:hypothetical protein
MTIRRWIFFLISLALGLGLGLFYAWVLSPVEYVDTTPGTLRVDYRSDYTLMVAEVFQSDQNIDQAARRLATLSSQPPVEVAKQALTFAQQNGYTPADIALLQNLIAALQVWQPGGTNP